MNVNILDCFSQKQHFGLTWFMICRIV